MASSSQTSYAQLLERTLLPIPTFQRLAVVSIFEKLRLDPDLDLDHSPARDALARCLTSPSAPVLDQSVRELCRLRLHPRRALLELLSALDGCPSPSLAPLLVKAIGLVSRLAFSVDPFSWRRHVSETRHPFVAALSCQYEACDEILRQLLLFTVQNLPNGVEAVWEFLHPVLAFSVLNIPFSDKVRLFIVDLISSVAAAACSFPSQGMGIINHLAGYLKLFPCRDEKDVRLYLRCTEYLVEAYIEVSKHSVRTEKLTIQTKACCLCLIEALVSVSVDLDRPFGGIDVVGQLSQRLLIAYKELGLDCPSEFVMVMISLSMILFHLELEHEQLSILKLLIYIIQWRSESQNAGKTSFSIQEFLLVLPVVNLVSSPSKPIKAAATHVLSMLESCLVDSLVNSKKFGSSYVEVLAASKPEVIVCRFLHHLWSQDQSFRHCMDIFDIICTRDPSLGHHDNKLVSWIYELTGKQYLVAENLNVTNVSQSAIARLSVEHFLLSIVSSILFVHPNIGDCTAKILPAVCRLNPTATMPLFMTILFYSKIFCSSGNGSEILLRLIEMLPSLTSHSLMVPLIVQTISPMLHKNVKPALNAIGIRLLCKTWAGADKCFGSLQDVLEKEYLANFRTRTDVLLSVAVSLHDVCKCNPDRGVDLIELVSSCIENHDSIIQAFGLESLSHLCGADVVDFYTAWKVIAKSTLNYAVQPVVARSLGMLLRWGAMDVDAYPDDSKKVIQILWDIATSQNADFKTIWSKARAAALESLVQYEVGIIHGAVANFKERNIDFLINEDSQEVLKVLENFEVNVINFEHITRRRLTKEKRPLVHKVEKLLDLLPQALLTSEKCSRDFPAALLLSHNFTPKEMQKKGSLQDLPKLHKIYEDKLLELADCLQLSRNSLCALLVLQSWKVFVSRWWRSASLLINTNAQLMDWKLQEAKEILKILCRCAETSIPRVAENIVLAIGAFCMVLESSMRSLVSSASDFLSKWLLQFEHEHRQWSAAFSLGLISNYLHATDRTRKYDIVSKLLKVMGESKSFFVKGACGIGLGFACQDLITAQINGNSTFEGTVVQTEAGLVGKIIRSFCLLIGGICPSTSVLFENLLRSFPVVTDEEVACTLSKEESVILEENSGESSGIAGVIIGLGQTIGAVHRLGAYALVLKIKDVLLSFIPVREASFQSYSCRNFPAFSIGACIILPTVVAFCEKAELVHNETCEILSVYRMIIAELLATKKSGLAHQYLLMASCYGAGTLLSCILTDGMHTLKLDDVKETLELIRTAFTGSNTPLIAFGGMLGIVNALGAEAGLLTDSFSRPSVLLGNPSQETLYITGPVLSSHALESFSTSIAQEVFMLAKDSENHQTKAYAAWALSFLRHRWRSEFQNSVDTKSTQSFSNDCVVWKLYMWLLHFQSSEVNMMMYIHTVVVVLRCLGKAPRIPVSSEWGRIVRYFMKQAAMFISQPSMESACRLLREECVSFCIHHANNVEPLLLFLDEVMDLPRFSRLEETLQLILLRQLCSITKLFHESRQEKLFSDLIDFFAAPTSLYLVYEPHMKCLMRISFWKGLFLCLDELPDSLDCLPSIYRCMEILFDQLPVHFHDENQSIRKDEWSEAVKCFSISRSNWLMDFLKVGRLNHETGGRFLPEVTKRLLAMARLVSIGRIPISELGVLKNYLFNSKTEDSWNLLIEVAVTVFLSDGSSRRQWLIDAVDSGIVSSYPSMALQFMGILSGICCKYRPFLVINPQNVLADLPITLSSLLLEGSWAPVREPLATKVWLLTERLCTWESHLQSGDDMPENMDAVDPSENILSHLLVDIMLQTCLSFKDHLPLEKQLKLANRLTGIARK